MQATSRKVSQLNGFSSVESVYAIPFVDSFYRPGNSQYALSPGWGDFRTTDIFYDPNRPITSTNKRDSTVFDNNADESNEKPIDSFAIGANENFAIGAVLFLTAGFFVFKWSKQ